MVFHDLNEQLLFAGDHVLPTITPSIGLEPVQQRDPLAAFLQSLALIRSRPDARLLPAHGPVTDSAHRRVDELVDHHGRRLGETAVAVGAGDGSAYDVAAALRWTRHLRRFDELDLFNRLLAAFETEHHLELLCAQGRLVRAPDGEVVRYRG